MLLRPFSYLFSISYYGARFRGWAKQTGQATVEGKLERAFRFVLGHDDFTMIGSSRTDSGVSCRSGFLQIFLREKVDLESLLPEFNQSLNGEISLKSVKEVSRDFNLIQSVDRKTYRYFFSDSTNFQPFSSAFLTKVSGINSFIQMQENARMFVGTHDFKAFCKKSENKSHYVREVLEAKVYKSQEFAGGFFPEQVYCFEVTGTGFLHHQVRKMVSAVWCFSADQIRERLADPDGRWDQISTAPPHGLVLWETDLRNL